MEFRGSFNLGKGWVLEMVWKRSFSFGVLVWEGLGFRFRVLFGCSFGIVFGFRLVRSFG